ncbi:MAG: DUF1697 domain-containing protein [Bacteroidales bacterium]|nr:DUF1697 domain-containing protein [Bacteroidales bacterium]
MKTYISILRGINVGGHKTIKMDALKKMYNDLHFENVQTYIQSGNVVFQSSNSNSKELEVIISTQIKKHFDFDVPVIVLDKKELKEIIENNPYLKDQTKDLSLQCITFLSSNPKQFNIEAIKLKQTQGEEFTITEKAVYMYCPNGFARTKLTITFFEKQLNVIATTRNLKTSNKLLSIASELV